MPETVAQALTLIAALSPRQRYVLGCCVIDQWRGHAEAVLQTLVRKGLLIHAAEGTLFPHPTHYTVVPLVAHAYFLWAWQQLETLTGAA